MDNESKLLSKCFPLHCYNKNKLYYANKTKLSNTELQFGLIYHCTLHIQNVPKCLVIVKNTALLLYVSDFITNQALN